MRCLRACISAGTQAWFAVMRVRNCMISLTNAAVCEVLPARQALKGWPMASRFMKQFEGFWRMSPFPGEPQVLITNLISHVASYYFRTVL